MTLTPGTILGPYEILAPIGAGGMGEVYKARDTRLGRIVAIKKVKEQHSERFKQEARSIAALNHPYICQLHDIGPDYLILEYVEGKPLSGPLPEKEAVRLAVQIATALEAAHKKGIIHRDLKPANIMVTDENSVKLLDFGLAKLYEQAAGVSNLPTADYPVTQAGAVIGTVAYMSPEQAQGQPADARSDVFSFGLVLYEMLSGRRAFSGDSHYAVMDAIVKKDPPSLQTSAALDKIVQRCLAKQPSGRYQSMLELKAALEQVATEKPSVIAAEPQPSIAVLPFVNMSGDKEQEYFSDGLAEEIINALTQIPGLRVIARTSAFAFKDKREDVRKIAEVLGVTNILEGSVRKAGNRIRATAQLIDASNGSHLWSERFDRDMNDVFALQDEISQAIADKLRIRFSGDRPLVKRHTINVEAYNLYLKARFQLLRLTPEGFAKSKEYYDQATALDPNYALAWHGLAEFCHTLGLFGLMPPKAANAQADQITRKVLQLDGQLAEAHAMMGALQASEYDWKAAELEFRRALALDPTSENVWSWYDNNFLVPMKRLDEAVAGFLRAVEMDPLSPFLQFRLGYDYFLKREYDRAIKQCRNALELDPQYYGAYILLGSCYFQIGKHDDAIRAMETQAQVAGRSSLAMGTLGWAYALTGRAGEASKILSELQDRAQKEYISFWSFAVIYTGLGEKEKAFDWFEKAVDEHDPLMLHFHVHANYDALRSHPRYHALLLRMNLEP